MTQTSADIIPTSSPLYFDKVAADINVKLAELGYIDDTYGVCYIGIEDEQSFPEIYQNNGSKVNFRVMPDSDRSMSFFIVTGDMVEIDEIGFQIPMALLFWGNLLKINNSKQYDYSPEILKDIYNILNKYGCADITVNVTDVFPEFSELDKAVAANTMRPYFAQRYEFTKNIQTCGW